MPRITIRSLNEKVDNFKTEIFSRMDGCKNYIINKLNKRKIKWKIFFLILFVIIFSISLHCLSTLDEYIPYQQYDYGLSTSEGFDVLRDFKIYHDFSKNVGSINFTLEKKDFKKDSTVILNLPKLENKSFENESIKIYAWKEKSDPIEVINWKTQYENQIVIEDLKPIDNEDTFYSVQYNLKILPHGTFTFEHSNIKLFGYSPIIVLDLGKNFQCYKSCIERRDFVNYSYPSTYREIRLKFERGSDHHLFILTGIKDIRIGQGLAIGFLVSSILSFFIVFKELLEESQKK